MVIPPKTWHQVFDRANGYCEYCGEDLLISRATYASAQVDHISGRAVGGGDNPENLRLACSECNSSLSQYNHLTTFEKRKAHSLQKIKEYHQRNYDEKRSKLRE
jgi:5-methylcytosine-specific restriction endonuclease McrA